MRNMQHIPALTTVTTVVLVMHQPLEMLDQNLVVESALADATKLGCTGALVYTDVASYGCSHRDLKRACVYARARAVE